MESDKTLFIVVEWDQLQNIKIGKSPYPAVNLRRCGLKMTHYGYKHFHPLNSEDILPDFELLDLRVSEAWFESVLEVIDKKKFMLARIKYGI